MIAIFISVNVLTRLSFITWQLGVRDEADYPKTLGIIFTKPSTGSKVTETCQLHQIGSELHSIILEFAAGQQTIDRKLSLYIMHALRDMLHGYFEL